MKHDFTQLTLWTEEELADLEVVPTDGETERADREINQSSHHSDLTQLLLPGFDDEVVLD